MSFCLSVCSTLFNPLYLTLCHALYYFLSCLHLIIYPSFSHSQETGQKTAVKVVSKKKLSDEDYASLLMEIEILTQLDHPHIIRYVCMYV